MALIDKASLLMVPSTYEAGKLYNVLPSGNRAPDSTDQNSGYDQTRADFDFDRGSNASATRIGSDGLLKKYRENLLLQSNNFSNGWSLTTGSSITGGQTGYVGSNDAWLLNDSGNSTAYAIYRGYTNTGVQTFSLYAKQASTSQIEFDFLGGSGGYLRVELTDGSLHQTNNSIDYNIENVGNGWYRCSFAVNQTSAPILVRIGCNGAGSVYIQNAQVEKGLVASSYLDSTSVTGKAGVLVDLPRINYDANGENGALLLEPSRQQLLQYSEYFSASGVWLPNTITITDNYGTSPEGLSNSTRLVLGNLTASRIAYAPSLTNGTTYTFSCWYKGTAGEKLYMEGNGSGGSGTQTSKLITLTGEWQREDLQFVGGSSSNLIYIVDSRNGTEDTAQDFEVFGAQIEAGSYPSSYIPNHGESGGVTRAADSCSVTGVSDVIGQTEGTLFVEAQITKNGRLFLIGATGNFIELVTTSGGVINAFVYNGSTQANINGSTIFDTGDTIKVAFAYKANDFALYVNGTANGTDTSGAVPSSMAQIIVNDYLSAGYNSANGYKQLALFNERLSNAELATLTTL
jgi:hypothetical protein